MCDNITGSSEQLANDRFLNNQTPKISNPAYRRQARRLLKRELRLRGSEKHKGGGVGMVMPKGIRQIVCVVLLSVIIVYSILVVSARLSGGRFGIIDVVGNSMSSVLPYGSQILVFPLGKRAGTCVVAWVDGDDYPQEKDDSKDGLIVKLMANNNMLVSTNTGGSYKEFDYRGRVVLSIPIQKIAWWRDKGSQNEYPGFSRRHEERVRNAKPISAEEQKRRQVEMDERGEKILALEKRMGIVPGSKVP